MDKRRDVHISAFDFSIVREAFRAMPADGMLAIDQEKWAAKMLEDLTGVTVVDPEILRLIIRK